MAPSLTLARALRLIHTLHDMTEHLPLNPESLLPEPPLRPSPFLGQPPLIPPPLHQPPHQQPQTRQQHHHQHSEQDTKEIHWNLAIACAAPVAYAPNNASKYGALSGATCTNAWPVITRLPTLPIA